MDTSSTSLSSESTNYLFYIYRIRSHQVLSENNISIFDMSFLEKSIKEFKSSYNSLNINIFELNSFSNYKQYLEHIEEHKKPDYYSLIRNLYQNVKHTAPSEANLYNNLKNSDDLKVILDLTNINIIIDNLLIWLSYVMGLFSGASKNKINAFFEQTKTLESSHIEEQEGKEEKITWESLYPKCPEVTKFLSSLQPTKTLEIKMNENTNTSNEANINLERMLLFYMFFDNLFPEFLNVKWDLNIHKLNQKYSTLLGNKALYEQQSNYIEEQSSNFQKSFISNLLLNKKIYSRQNLHLTLSQYDDYIIEISNLLHNEINLKNNCSKNIINQRYNSNFLMASTILELNIEFNSMDDLLFQNVLFLLYQNLISDQSNLMKITINLFPKEAFSNINPRKMLKNYLFFPNNENRFNELELDSKFHEKSLNFKYRNDYNWNNENKRPYISDDKIIDILYGKFQANLMHLIYLLDKNTTINFIFIQANLPFILQNKQNYSMSLIYFFHNFFTMLNLRKDKLHLGTIELETNIDIPLFFMQKTQPVKLDGVKIQTFKMKIGNSSGLIDYNHFPFYYVDYLHLSKVNLNDLQNIINAFKNSTYAITTLRQFKLELDYLDNIDMNIIKELCKECLPNSIRVFWMFIYNEFTMIQVDEFISTIVKAVNYCETTRIYLEAEFNIYIDIDDFKIYTGYYYRSLLSEHLSISSEWNPEFYFYYEDYAFHKEGNVITIKLKINKWETNDSIRDFISKLKNEINLSESNNIMQSTGSIMKMLFKPTSVINLKFNLIATEN